MAITARLVGKGAAAAASTTTAAGTSSVSGSTFLQGFSYDASTAVTSVTDSKSNAYIKLGITYTGAGLKTEWWISQNGVGGSAHTGTATFSGTAFASNALIEVTGADASGIDVTTGRDNSSTHDLTISVGAFAQADEVVLAVVSAGDGGTVVYSDTTATFSKLAEEQDGNNFWTSAVWARVISSTAAFNVGFSNGSPGGSFLAGSIVSIKQAAAGGSIAADGISTGTATVSGVSGAIAGVSGSSSGLAIALGIALSIFPSQGGSVGTSNVTGQAGSVVATTGSAVGTSIGTGVSNTIFASTGTSVGTSTVTAVGNSIVPSLGSVDGVSTVTGIANAVFPSVGTSVGTSTVTGAGETITPAAETVGTSIGTSVALGIGASFATTQGDSLGLSTVSGIAQAIFPSTGSSTGTSTVTGAGEIVTNIIDTIGTADGGSVVTGIAVAIFSAQGDSAGSTTVTGVSASTSGSVGNSVGTSTATGLSGLGGNAPAGSAREILIVRQAKTVVDVHTIIEGVERFLGPTETIFSVVSRVEVHQGIDPSPNDVLGPSFVQFVGTEVRQQIQRGLPGVIYNVIMDITTNLANVITLVFRQAVLPIGVGTFIFPAQFGIFTSPNYPYQFSESMTMGHELIGGRLFGLVTGFAETLGLSHNLTGGLLRDILQTTSFTETLTLSHSLVGGLLIDLLQTTSFTETMTLSHSLQGGSMPAVLLRYENWPQETLSLSHSITGGTLA